MKYCREVAIELGLEVPAGPFLPVICCDSCHEDSEYGYEELIWVDDDTARVCCGIFRLLPEELESL